jgi:hypothetical protein
LELKLQSAETVGEAAEQWEKFVFKGDNMLSKIGALMTRLQKMPEPDLAKNVDLTTCAKRRTSKVRWHATLEGARVEQAHVVAHPALRPKEDASSDYDKEATHWYSLCFESGDKDAVLKARDKLFEMVPELRLASQKWSIASYPAWLLALEA